MRYGSLPAISKPISRLVQGTTMLDADRQEYSFALLDAVFAAGCTTFDTAHVYGQGMQERVFGQWLRERGLREQVVIIGKGAHQNQDRRRVTPYDITADLHDSLARLQIEQIDLYLLHRDDPAVAVGPIVETLDAHRRAGLICAYGGSNWSHTRIAEANAYAETHGLAPFVASSPNYSLAEQIKPPWEGCISLSGPAQAAARAWYAEVGMALFTWSSLAGGFFSGRFRRDNLASFSSYMDRLCVECYCNDANFTRLERASQLAEQKGLTLPQIALAYVLSQPLDIYALVGCQTPEEFRANVAAADLHLSANECAWLDVYEGDSSR